MIEERFHHDSLRLEERPKTLRELALDRLRHAIVTGRFEPGERLVERSLCERLGVSRSVVREVVRHLEAEGLVESLGHQGPIVARIDAASAAEIYEIRALLEGEAAAACARNASAEDVKALAGALSGIEDGYAHHDIDRVLESAERFYELLFRTADKKISWEVVKRLNGRISRLRVLTISSEGRHESGPRQMRAIFEAISASDPGAAKAACNLHLATAAKIAKDRLEEEQGRVHAKRDR